METHIGKGVGKFIENELFSAKKYLLIASPVISFNLGKRIFEMLRNGVNIRIITSEKAGEEAEKTNLLANELTKTKLEERKGNLDYKIVSQKEVALMHAKIFVIDGKCAIIGSANLSENSFWNFAEYILISREPEQIRIIENDFEKLWNTFSYCDISESDSKRKLRSLARTLRRKI